MFPALYQIADILPRFGSLSSDVA